MGGLWVVYNLMSTVPGLHVLGEANFSDHGANRLGASALMQGLADGYFVLPYTIGHWFATASLKPVGTDHPEFRRAETEAEARLARLLGANGTRSPDSFHRELGALMWDKAGMARNRAGLQECLQRIPALREQFWADVRVLGTGDDLNTSLEKAGRVADFLEFAELLCADALAREESCGGHFREEHQTPDGEARRDDANFCFGSVWEWTGQPGAPRLHREPLVFENVRLATRSYK
jgi:succinate dehydrogenase / fumarate reductase flavoprotein subunit